MNKSEFMRECVLKNRTRIIAKSKISIEKKRMLFVFNKAGNNLNQIAHVLNSANLNKKLTETTLRDALLALSNISAYLKTALNYVD